MEQEGFLPPQAAGREPELGPPSPPPQPALTGGFAPPAGAAPSGQTAPAPQQAGWHQSGWHPQPGVGQQPAPAWAPAATGPDNGPAVLGFSLALSSIGLLLVSAGFSTLVSLGLGIVGITQSSKGKRRVRDGQTAKHRDLAQAGFVIGIVATVLSVLATLFWIGIVVAIAVDDGTRRDFERQLDDRRGEPAVLTAAALAGIRLVGLLLS